MIDELNTIENLQKAISVMVPTYDIPSIIKTIQPMVSPAFDMPEIYNSITKLGEIMMSNQLKVQSAFRPIEDLASIIQRCMLPVSIDGSNKKSEIGLLEVSFGQYGEIRINGNLFRANAVGSKHGRLLQFLNDNPNRLISNKEMKESANATNAANVLHDLKKELRQIGYKLRYRRYKSQGLIYMGVVTKE